MVTLGFVKCVVAVAGSFELLGCGTWRDGGFPQKGSCRDVVGMSQTWRTDTCGWEMEVHVLAQGELDQLVTIFYFLGLQHDTVAQTEPRRWSCSGSQYMMSIFLL